ncbi:MAG: hypothetical protein LBR26_13995 [Prevotella sp.]|jgi:hypothetical protein|nr:hypothetical protein [Prevotella sp.]
MENVNFGAIAILIVFLAIIGHIIYELFFKKKFVSYTTDYFRQVRITNDKTEYASNEEHEEAGNLLEKVFKSWPTVEITDDNEFREPLKTSQVKESTTLLNAVITVCPTDEALVNRLNELTGVINAANKRIFNGSKALVIIAFAIFILISLISGTWSGAAYFIGSIVFYILASFTPAFVIDRKIANGKEGKSSFMTSLIGGLFGTIATAKTVKYIDRDTREVVDTDNSRTWIAMFFTFIVLFLLSSFIAVIALINYIRNYWLNI